jgi:hypothetical protein
MREQEKKKEAAIPSGEGVVYEADQQIMQRIQDVVSFRLGHTIDDVRGNAQILSGIA